MKISTLMALGFILLNLSLISGCGNTVHGMGHDMDRITGR